MRVVDSAGNPTAGASGSLEVCLAASALATDGSGGAAAVSAQGGNKAKAKSGSDGCWVAVFKDVRVSAEAAGTYALRAQSTSRKIAVADGTLALALAPQNVVAGVEVQVPEELREGVEAGGAGARGMASGGAADYVAALGAQRSAWAGCLVNLIWGVGMWNE